MQQYLGDFDTYNVHWTFAAPFFSTPWECLLQPHVSCADPALPDSKLPSLL